MVVSLAVYGFAQELLILVTFALSYSLWQYLKPKKPGSHFSAPSKVESKGLEATCSFSEEEKERAKDAQKEMLRLLASHEFTRALNQYRGLERLKLEPLLSEELYGAFVHAATRVNKADVAERMLRTMKRIRMRPLLQFWQQTMRVFSSRKSFELCLLAHSIFEHQIPADKIVFSCLINAALELEKPERTPVFLQKINQAAISPKDHILHFRCYVQLGNAHAAEELWRRLGFETTSLMLNLLLLTWVNQKEPERAYRILQEAKLKETGPEKLVDIVSYNTVIKGFAAARCRPRCLDCMRDLIEHGLRPDDITLAALMDVCVADSDYTIVNEIGDLIVASHLELKPAMCSIFIRGLVRAGATSKALALYASSKPKQLDVAAFSMLIKALVDQRDLNTALQVAEDLKQQHALDDIVLTHLMEGCRHENQYELGKKIFTDALAKGLVPSDVALVTWLKLLGSCGAHEEAYDTVKNCELWYRKKPSVIHYTCLMSGCFRCRRYDQAWAAYEMMLASGVRADDTTISTMLAGMLQGQKWQQVEALIQKAPEGARRALRGLPGKQAEELKAVMRKAKISE